MPEDKKEKPKEKETEKDNTKQAEVKQQRLQRFFYSKSDVERIFNIQLNKNEQ